MDLIQTEDVFLLVVAIAAVLGILAVMIFFLLAQQNTLKAIQPENRLMRPGEVWLQLIPAFNLVWQFIVVTRISDSIRREFASWPNDSVIGISEADLYNVMRSRPTYDIGIAYCVLNLCGCIPFFGTLASIACLICWIIYWTRLVEFKRKIETKII